MLEMPPELIKYTEQQFPKQQQYIRALWSVMEDEIGSEYPEHADYGISFHRSLEIHGVVEHYHDTECRKRKAERQICKVNPA